MGEYITQAMLDDGKQGMSTHNWREENVFTDWPENGEILRTVANSKGVYEIHVRFENGIGLKSTRELNLEEALSLYLELDEKLELGPTERYIDLPNHVLEQSSIFNKKILEAMKKKGMYFKTRNKK
ncbi:hypothetical protein [Luteimonas abyssi]|uniref:hypothetical protein n=1 Tax=Luteimonas abyssi TaxID=1247514 RepID=UPI0012FA14D3|nr:hypothetical protein [Luteimonas abyssi]